MKREDGGEWGGARTFFPAGLGQEGTSISVFLLGTEEEEGLKAPESLPKNIVIGYAHVLQLCQA